ncbi:MAG: hypothetical protein HY966_02320 [Ignavibacteriales bacterium]|nr:hypothetical protein [Ignavibacteriales bacterium]
MNRVILSAIFFLLAVSVPALGQHADQHKHTHMNQPKDTVMTTYSCPMHPNIKSDKPGTCTKCGMDLVARVSTAPMKRDTAATARPTKQQLIENGKYNCCIKEPCDECYRDGENCACYTAVKKSGIVCRECYKGWQEGIGRVPGVSKDSVKTFPTHK